MYQRYKIRNNIYAILQDDIAVLLGALSFGGILYLGLNYIDLEFMSGNLGVGITYTEIITHRILALLFGLFVAGTVYKIRWMKQFDTKKTSSGLIGGFISTIIMGCPTCSIGLASYLGLGGILFNLPGFGLEIKLLGLVVLTRATRSTVNNLYVCKR